MQLLFKNSNDGYDGMMKQLRVGLVGAAHRNRWFLAASLMGTRGAVVGVADPDEAARESFRRLYRAPVSVATTRELIDRARPDAVFVFPGPGPVLPDALEAIGAGCAVYADKHIARSVAELDRLEEALSRSPVALAVRLNKPLVPAYRRGLALVGVEPPDGIGRPLVYSSDFHAGPYGSIHNFVDNHLVFHLDLAWAAIGRFEIRSALCNATATPTVGLLVTLCAEEGAIGTINATSYLPGDHAKERLEIVGHAGAVRVENARRLTVVPGLEPGIPAGPSGGFGLTWEETGAQLEASTRNGYEEQVRWFLDVVASDEARPGDGQWRASLDRLRHHEARLREVRSLLSR